MKHIALPVTGATPVGVVSFGGRRKSLFASIISALHHTRRIQARRVLKQHQHLFDRAAQRRAEQEGRNHVAS
ncbi:hypothetical protein IC762_32475 [Bradyrhizobium genosp. L]|uniref:hypothetical protein n=1 Tax=Bradyrhizobium genosp. L TaxID=83637 RepID=UPI0018A2655B|nr:hypothetical protein [Bradyrhizobium genosp. L]QPF84282.1 hypothetical protein IC762_32475 [Bradyrhizobium genosp. L]